MGHEIAYMMIKLGPNDQTYVYEYNRTEEGFRVKGGFYAEAGEFYEESLFGGRLNFNIIARNRIGKQIMELIYDENKIDQFKEFLIDKIVGFPSQTGRVHNKYGDHSSMQEEVKL